jgi:hypothetical protein
MTNKKNAITEEIKTGLNSRNPSYHSVQKLFLSSYPLGRDKKGEFVLVQATKEYRGSRGTASLIFNHGARCGGNW